jgi:uncharacterized protein
MRWTPGGRSEDLEDLRGQTGGGMMQRGVPLGIGGVLLLIVISLLTGQDFLSLIGGPAQVSVPDPQQQPVGSTGVQSSPQEDQLVEFVSDVLDDSQDTWSKLLPGRYRRAKLVLFRDMVPSACGRGEAAMGPFYCPNDERVYIDLSFYEELKQRFGAPGDAAQAYVLAHEIGHHVQKLLGIESQVRRMQEARPGQANALSVAMELQADCFAGVWGHSAIGRQIVRDNQVSLDEADIQEGLRAAAAIGDDRIQRMTTGRVQPESFTHGSSQQRSQWFARGVQSGAPDTCDTFGSRRGT